LTRVSDLLRRLAEDPSEEDVSLGELKDALAEKAFAVLMLAFALPNLLPVVVPGTSAMLGTPLALLSWQMAAGRKAPWLPRLLAERPLPRKDFRAVLSRCVPHLARTERFLRPRLSPLLRERVLGGICLVMAVLIALPIPLANWLPALAVCLFSLAILERDGLCVLYGVAAACAGLAAASSVIAAFAAACAYAAGRMGL
jgi:hypothetical protein